MSQTKTPHQVTQDRLPLLPSGGNRRRLDALWLERLETDGLPAELNAGSDRPPELDRSIEEFNRRLFWECHETLEDMWRGTTYPLRLFYHGVIKAAVGFHHLSQHNSNGARVKLGDSIRLLGVFQPRFMGVDTERLRADVSAWLPRLDGPGPADWRTLDALPTPQIHVSEVTT